MLVTGSAVGGFRVAVTESVSVAVSGANALELSNALVDNPRLQ